MRNLLYWKFLTKFASTLAWVSLLCIARADTLEFKNGDRLTGKLINEENGQIYFNSDLLGKIYIKAAIVANVKMEDSPAVVDIETPTDVDSEEPAEAKIGKESELPKTEIAKQKKALKKGPLRHIPGIGFLAEHRPLKKWNSDLKAGFGWQTGERDKVDVSVRFESIYKTEKSDFRLNARYTYGNQKGSDGTLEKNSDRYETSLRYRRDRSDRLFIQSNSRYLKDLIKNIDGEYEQSIGFGWKYLDKVKIQGSITPSITAQYQQIDNLSKGWDFLTTLFQDFQIKISDKFTFYEETVFSVDPGDTHLFTIDFISKIEARFTKALHADLRWEVDFDNNIAPGVDKSQKRVLLAFGYKF